MRKCKDWLDGYMEYTEDWESPRQFAKWVGIVTLAVAAGRRVWYEEGGGSRVWPNLYVVLTGPSGIGKGQSMREALPFLDALAIPRSPDHITMASLVSEISLHPQQDADFGLITPYLLWAEELPSFLGMDAWKSGKLADLTTLFDCAELWRKSTVKDGVAEIIKPYLCLLGGCTPSGIYDVLPPASVGQGFTSRVIFPWAAEYTKRVPVKPWTQKHQLLREALLNDILEIKQLSGAFKLTDMATVLWSDYYRYRPDPVDEFDDERMRGFAARKPFYVKKLALLFRLSDPAPGQSIEAHHLERAIQELDDVCRDLKAVYDEIAPSNIVRHYPKVIKHMLRQGGSNVGHSLLFRKFSHSLNRQEFAEVMAGLVDMGIIATNAAKTPAGRFQTVYSLTKKSVEKLI